VCVRVGLNKRHAFIYSFVVVVVQSCSNIEPKTPDSTCSVAKKWGRADFFLNFKFNFITCREIMKYYSATHENQSDTLNRTHENYFK